MQNTTPEKHDATMPSGPISRRDFLKAGAVLAAGGSLTHAGPATPSPQRLDSLARSHVDRLQDAPVTLIYDALARLGYDRSITMSGDIKPVFKTRGTVIGPAVTTKYEAARGNATQDDIRNFVFKPVDEAPAGAVWVTGAGTDQLLSMFGDLIVLACRKRGILGLVTDSGCRDIEAMEDIGLPVYARGPVLYGPGSVIRPVAANVPVFCGGVEVRPGDIVAADVNGVLAFPADALPDVVRVKKELEEKEVRTRRQIDRGASLVTAYTF